MDDARFEQVWSAHAPAVLRYCTYSIGSVQEGEDVAAETFAAFLMRGDRVPPERTEAWLIRVARNLCASHHRSAARQHRLRNKLAAEPAMEADEWVRPDTWEYLRALKESERLVVFLRVAEDRSFADIARIIGKSEPAAKMTFYRATDRLRALMQAEGAVTRSGLVGGVDHA